MIQQDHHCPQEEEKGQRGRGEGEGEASGCWGLPTCDHLLGSLQGL